MGRNDNNYKGVDKRTRERRACSDRRVIVRFEDVLGRRSGVERRITTSK